MRIAKNKLMNNVSASTQVNRSAKSKKMVKSSIDSMFTYTCKYDESIQLIKEAINCLGMIAKDDEVAKEAIANLSVVLLDLNSQC